MSGKHNKLGEGERKVRLGQDSLPNIAFSVAETSRNYIRCFTRTLVFIVVLSVVLPNVAKASVMAPLISDN